MTPHYPENLVVPLLAFIHEMGPNSGALYQSGNITELMLQQKIFSAPRLRKAYVLYR